ncbi:hypothetical protein RF11_04336 [Thelohanellus kitauei]|uniref:Uncharacterized protein n=1 Tax=Thelohanellus kitauei TaxID=669202 RepID=A0A0C2N2F8_THEKT|nr:hypothetical protein RF11_04336 [Thelohanellus kitauei]
MNIKTIDQLLVCPDLFSGSATIMPTDIANVNSRTFQDFCKNTSECSVNYRNVLKSDDYYYQSRDYMDILNDKDILHTKNEICDELCHSRMDYISFQQPAQSMTYTNNAYNVADFTEYELIFHDMIENEYDNA